MFETYHTMPGSWKSVVKYIRNIINKGDFALLVCDAEWNDSWGNDVSGQPSDTIFQGKASKKSLKLNVL